MSINPSQMQIFGHAVTTQMDDNSALSVSLTKKIH